MMRRLTISLCIFLLSFFPLATAAADDIPEQLKPWVPWVLHDQEQRFCTLSADGSERFCGTFSQSWLMKRSSWIFLPGNTRNWPKEVTVNAEPARVVSRNGQPAIYVKEAGNYSITGSFQWKNLPESIPVAAGTGIVRLTVDSDERVADLAGDTLWLSRSRQQTNRVENTVHTQVYRLITDSIPMVVTTQIDVQVSGTPREILLDWQLPTDQIPLSLQSALPVMIGTDRRIHMQARPGNHTVIFQSRLKGPVDSLTFAASATGPDEEYWSFQAQNRLRVVKISGEAVAVDPGQTSIPAKWHQFPAWRVKKGESLQFKTVKRGDPEPPPNDLRLHRTFWLDSDGSGITVQGKLQGTVNRNPRLVMQPPAKLGRMVINGRDQLITRLKEGGPAGVEVRQGSVDAMAVSRIEEVRSFPAGGWGQSIAKLSGELILPPGWMLFHASGIDRVQTWITRWTLLDCFIVLIIVISCFRLLGRLAGLTALVGLLLSCHDPQAPLLIWLVLLCCIAIIQALPDSKYIALLKKGKLVLLLSLVIMVLPYSVEQLRVGLFPQLERVFPSSRPVMNKAVGVDYAEPEMAATDEGEAVEGAVSVVGAADEMAGRKVLAKKSSSGGSAREKELQHFRENQLQQHFDANARVQAGPGVPAMKWRRVGLTWNGPVEKELNISLLLLSPFVNLLLAVVKVAALFLLTFFMIDFRKGGDLFFHLTAAKKSAVAVLAGVLLLVVAVPGGYCGEYPSPELLDEMRDRLLEPADCFPDCADFTTMRVDLRGAEMSVSLQAEALSECAVQVPFGTGIFWRRARLDNSSAPLLADGKNFWVTVPEGRHQITLSGRVNRADVQLQLPRRPHAVTFTGHGEWSVAGLDENSVPENRLQFTREQQQQKQQTSFATSTLPPLMRVDRTFNLGLQWQIETVVTRESPLGSSVFLKIPLLAGESVLNPEFQVENGTIMIPFGANEQQKRYLSTFQKQNTVVLTAPNTTEWYETWRLNASPVWHVETDGIAPILHHGRGGSWQPEWRPWPDEKLTLSVTRPQGVPGPTKMVESSVLRISPGIRSTTMRLFLTIRSTRGDQQKLTLPEDAVVQFVRINGREQPVKKDRVIILPLSPTTHRVEIEWRTAQGMTSLFTVPEINLGTQSVNAGIEIAIGNRWIWFVSGPQMGPAVLFYSEMLIILLVAVVLGRSRLTPLRSFHWLLLGLGLCQSGLIPCLIIVVWFLAMRIRKEKAGLFPDVWFDLTQTALVLLSLTAIGALVLALQNGLLGHPDMLISGNNSSSSVLRWYQDRVTAMTLPQPVVVSVPMMVYRITMLAWALWMAFHLLHWVKWGWNCFTSEHIWKKIDRKKTVKKPAKTE